MSARTNPGRKRPGAKPRANEARLVAWRQRAVRRMERSRAASLRFFQRLPERAILEPRTQGNWSVKDTFAHIVAWEEDGARRLELIRRGRGDRIHFYDDMAEADRFNARAVRRTRRWSWAALLGRAGRVRTRLGEAFLRLPPVALDDPSHRYPVTAWLPEFAWTHEADHLARIRAWWRQRRA